MLRLNAKPSLLTGLSKPWDTWFKYGLKVSYLLRVHAHELRNPIIML